MNMKSPTVMFFTIKFFLESSIGFLSIINHTYIHILYAFKIFFGNYKKSKKNVN